MDATAARQFPRYTRYLFRRTKMIGGGTSYDVFVPAREVERWRIHCTTIISDPELPEREWVHYDSATLPERHEPIPIGWDRYVSWRKHERAAKNAMLRLSRLVFPELSWVPEWPTLWVPEINEESASVILEREAPNATRWTTSRAISLDRSISGRAGSNPAAPHLLQTRPGVVRDDSSRREITMEEERVELLDGPDEQGRYMYTLHWMADYHPGHPDGEYARRERGQVFFGRPPNGIPQTDRRAER